MVQVVRKYKRSGQITAAGILTIIASCASFILGIFSFASIILYLPLVEYNYSWYNHTIIWLLITTIFAFIGFSYGIASGIYTLKRKNFIISITGVFALLIPSVISVTYFIYFIFLGVPILVLGIISLTFIITFQHEYTS